MTGFEHWTPDTGTCELPSTRRGWPLEDQPTAEIAWWQPLPEVTVTRYVRPSRLGFVRRLFTGAAVCAGLLLLSAVPNPAPDAPASVGAR